MRFGCYVRFLQKKKKGFKGNLQTVQCISLQVDVSCEHLVVSYYMAEVIVYCFHVARVVKPADMTAHPHWWYVL